MAANSIVSGWADKGCVRRGLMMTDWHVFHDVGAFAETAWLGGALRRVLTESRLGLSAEWANERREAGDYDQRLANAFGLKSSRKLYLGMKNADAWWSLGEITLSPTRHRRGSAFGGFPASKDTGREDIIIPFASSDDEIGLAVKACIARCL